MFARNRKRIVFSIGSILLLLERGILFCCLRALLRKREYEQEMIQSTIGRTRMMTSSGQRTASFLVERFRVLSREPISGKNATSPMTTRLSFCLFPEARLGIVPMSLSRAVAIPWKSYNASSCKGQLRKSV